MQMIIAVVRPHKLKDVREALGELGVVGMTVTDVRGCGRQRGHVERYRGAEYVIDLIPKVKMEVVVLDEQLDAAVASITEAARTGEIGDGKIFILPVDQAFRIRTGEKGSDAI